MNYKARQIAAAVLTAVMLSGCGAAVGDDTLPELPVVDQIAGESVAVSSHSAGAYDPGKEDVFSETSAVGTEAEEDTVLETEDETSASEEDVQITDSEEDTAAGKDYYDENGEKLAFDFLPEYDEEFFADDLFIGDSITTGFSGYGILDEKNVFAKIGLNPLTALDTPIDTADGERLLAEEISETCPKRAYIMLGSNGICWLACSNMLDAISDIADEIREISPDTEIVCLSIPPVTKEYDDEETELEVMDKIKDYNSRLEEMCGEKGLTYIDITTMLEDNDGYFVYYYAETDGVHFKPTAYKMLLSKIQYTLS